MESRALDGAAAGQATSKYLREEPGTGRPVVRRVPIAAPGLIRIGVDSPQSNRRRRTIMMSPPTLIMSGLDGGRARREVPVGKYANPRATFRDA